ncbi:MAG: hypothetical protein ACRENQ_12930 [Gemmatimonadaceae bacterium]
MLSKTQLASYGVELRNAVDAARYRLKQLDRLASEWLAVSEAWRLAPHDEGPSLAPWGQLQAETFDEIDAFLAAFVRVSLLVFPEHNTGFAAERGVALQAVADLPPDSVLGDREFRDGWLHHDERFDYAVEHGLGHAAQRFTVAGDVSDRMKSAHLRIVEMDTRIVHYRDRTGGYRQASLRAMGDALKHLDGKWQLLVL